MKTSLYLTLMLLLCTSSCIKDEFPEISEPQFGFEDDLFEITAIELLEPTLQTSRVRIFYDSPIFANISEEERAGDFVGVRLGGFNVTIPASRTFFIPPQTFTVGSQLCVELRYQRSTGETSTYSEYCKLVE